MGTGQHWNGWEHGVSKANSLPLPEDTLIKSSAITAFALEKYSTHSSVVSAIINMWRTCGGFAVSYFQASWIHKDGVVAVFATQAAIVGVSAVLLVGTVIWMGKKEAKRGIVVDIESDVSREQGVVREVKM